MRKQDHNLKNDYLPPWTNGIQLSTRSPPKFEDDRRRPLIALGDLSFSSLLISIVCESCRIILINISLRRPRLALTLWKAAEMEENEKKDDMLPRQKASH